MVTRGVPQGSVIGPLLFLIFVNGLPSSVDNTRFLLFADDITFIQTNVNLKVTVQEFQT